LTECRFHDRASSERTGGRFAGGFHDQQGVPGVEADFERRATNLYASRKNAPEHLRAGCARHQRWRGAVVGQLCHCDSVSAAALPWLGLAFVIWFVCLLA